MSLDPNEGQPVRGQAVEWLMRLQEAPHDQRLRADVDTWLQQSDEHRRAFSAMSALWGQAEDVGALRARRGQPEGHRSRALGPRKRRWAAAAGLALAASLALLAFPGVQLWLSADHQTGVAELKDIVLDDGSRVTLNARTAISVEYTSSQRTVNLLSGQAYFEVTPSRERPFLVRADTVAVRVTGTAFSVGTSDAGVAVAVRSGSVNVSEPAKGVVADLAGGQQVQFSRRGVPMLGTTPPDDVAAWRERRLIVYDEPLREVVSQIARHTNTVVLFADSRIAEESVTAIVDLRRPDEALRTVVGLKYGKVTQISPLLAVISSR